MTATAASAVVTALIYCRVSSREQEREGISLDRDHDDVVCRGRHAASQQDADDGRHQKGEEQGQALEVEEPDRQDKEDRN